MRVRRARVSPAGGPGERGATLVELLVTVLILGTSVVALLGSLGNSVVISDVQRKQATAQNAVRSFAEAVKAASYQTCATSYTADDFAPPSGFTATVVRVEHWDAGTRTYGPAPSTCPGDDAGLQRVVLRVSAGARATEAIEVVKREP